MCAFCLEPYLRHKQIFTEIPRTVGNFFELLDS